METSLSYLMRIALESTPALSDGDLESILDVWSGKKRSLVVI